LFTAQHSKGKAITGPVTIEEAEFFYVEMKITDKCYEVSKSICKKLVGHMYCFVIHHSSSPIGARLQEFYCNWM
jgi:hypothetical protein